MVSVVSLCFVGMWRPLLVAFKNSDILSRDLQNSKMEDFIAALFSVFCA